MRDVGPPPGLIRREHVKTEANIIGIAVLALFAGLDLVHASYRALLLPDVGQAVCLLLAGATALIAAGLLRAFRPLGRVLFAVDAVLVVCLTVLISPASVKRIAIQLGLSAVSLWVLFGRKADVVVSDRYRQRVLAATRDIQPRPTVGAYVVLVAFLAAALCVPG